jgi:TolB protein
MKILPRLLLLAGIMASAPSHAERLPVLQQIDLPHPYYFREMYLPQLTSGPSSLAWSPDSTELIYSMAGSLWRQKVGAPASTAGGDATAGGVAQQLTADSYDYQPDWSADGRWVIYSSYRNDAMELWVLDLAGGKPKPLLANGAVNVEPRFSPDGKRIVFVSTLYHKRFHIFTADIDNGRLSHVERLTGEHKSELPRYYYSPFDHEINPVWSRDGRDILYVSNRNHIYGTGGFWRTPSRTSSHADAAAAGAESAAGEPAGDAAHEIHYEETNWKARPDVSPDGSRLVFSSYQGRSWHNLWVMPAGEGMPLRSATAIGIKPIRAGRRTAPASPIFPTRAATRKLTFKGFPAALRRCSRFASGATCRPWRACILTSRTPKAGRRRRV